ncbi:Por secretion system C-terminal sorting domain-containing protein [Dyadobacter soli]|uniref:Por secretion system C-terminal sorting domain-containing protein n=1 Tax=Dyadobacter soli TaxID=659014 RepID=A0A1G7K3H4_9BACT|nr:T9SS type A sorting domain-containing protein [Dyadobacter soli]SDF31672.1 Por secretion system C-terminal sorting domain-containing protein [Dyadobacter soli]
MKTFTFILCLLLSAIASHAAAPAGGYAGNSSKVNAAPAFEPFSMCFEAETSNGNGPISSDPNASDNLTRGARDGSDYWVSYSTSVYVPGKYQITLRYYAEQDSPVMVTVNNDTLSSMQVTLPASHSWNIAWREHTFEVNLRAGGNTVKIAELPGYNVRQDKACWLENGPSEPECDFDVYATVDKPNAQCSETLTFTAQCAGACDGVAYDWSGGGLNFTGQSVSVPAPKVSAGYNYFLTATKEGCGLMASRVLVMVNCDPVPSGPFTTCVEAENSISDGEITDDPNASNGKTRGTQNGPSYSVEYEINGVKTTGPHQVTLRYYSTHPTGITISVNGEETAPLTGLEASGSWNVVWAEKTYTFNLKEGNNRIKIWSGFGYPVIRQDKICVTGSSGPVYPSACNFIVSASASTLTPACSTTVDLNSTCVGPDCGSVAYKWLGQGINATTASTTILPPSGNGTYTYSLVASKNGCVSVVLGVDITVSGCDAPSGPFSVCKESEWSAGNGPNSSDPNASNGQTKGAQNNYDYYVDYDIPNVPTSGMYPVTLRYYAEPNAQVSVSVNGNIAIPALQLPPTYSWNIVWREETFNLNLSAGNNTIRIQGLPGTATRQDKICVGNSESNARMAAPEFVQNQSDPPLLQAFPNPAPGEFKATFNLKTGETGTIKVTDVQGKVWHTRSVRGKGAHEERITLDNAPAGIYLLQVKKPDSVETKKILLTR